MPVCSSGQYEHPDLFQGFLAVFTGSVLVQKTGQPRPCECAPVAKTPGEVIYECRDMDCRPRDSYCEVFIHNEDLPAHSYWDMAWNHAGWDGYAVRLRRQSQVRVGVGPRHREKHVSSQYRCAGVGVEDHRQCDYLLALWVPNPESTEGGRRVSVLKRQEGVPVNLG